MGYSTKTPTIILPSNPRYNYIYDLDDFYSSAAEVIEDESSYTTMKTASVDVSDMLFLYFELDLHLRKTVVGFIGYLRVVDDESNSIMLQTSDYLQYQDVLTGDYAAYESKKGFINVSNLDGTQNINFQCKSNITGRGDVRLKNVYLFPQKISLEV